MTEPEPQMFEAAVVITATAYATHPDGADVPAPFPNPALTQEQS